MASAADVGGRGRLKRIGDVLAYGALRGVWAGLGAVSLPVARRGLEAVAVVFSRLDRRHRRVVLGNLDIAFPGMDLSVRASVLDASFRNWGRLGAEIVHGDELIDAAAADPDWQALARAVSEGLEGGRGLLVLTAHLGNFELLARLFGRAVGKVAVFHRPLGIPEIDGFLIRERERFGVTSLGRGAVVRDALRFLAAGGCVALPLDQNQREGRGVFVDVLGHPACTSTVLARLSLASGAPVLPVFSVWMDGVTRPVIGELIRPPHRPSSAEREGVLLELTCLYSAEVDRAVRRFPHQWNWAHRRWKTRPAS